VLYTRAGCHLCDEAKQQLSELRKHTAFTLREVDIDQDPELRQRYNDEVPVIFIHGRKAFKYRINPRQFLRRLQAQ
jgi:glutaredoxin